MMEYGEGLGIHLRGVEMGAANGDLCLRPCVQYWHSADSDFREMARTACLCRVEKNQGASPKMARKYIAAGRQYAPLSSERWRSESL